MPPVPRRADSRLREVEIGEMAAGPPSQVVDIGVEVGLLGLALLRRKAEVLAGPQRLEVPQGGVPAAMGVRGQRMQQARGLRPMPRDMGEPAERPLCRAHIAPSGDVVEGGAAEAVRAGHGSEPSPGYNSGEGSVGSRSSFSSGGSGASSCDVSPWSALSSQGSA